MADRLDKWETYDYFFRAKKDDSPQQLLRLTGVEAAGNAAFECNDFIGIQESLTRFLPSYDFLVNYAVFDACLHTEQHHGSVPTFVQEENALVPQNYEVRAKCSILKALTNHTRP
jgi:hypothetical protein